jgi:hypothetical protein
MKYFKLLSFPFLLTFLYSCSDYSKELGGNYFLNVEGKNINVILNHRPNTKGIPPAILKYNYNNDFIIAEQKPNINDNILDETANYKNGRDSLYYWIIVKKNSLCLGPFNLNEFNEAKLKNIVPETLKLKDIY